MEDDGQRPLPIAPKKLDFEDRLEELVVSDPSLINLSILVIGRQIPTKYGGYIDVLGVDVEGRVHVIELGAPRLQLDEPEDLEVRVSLARCPRVSRADLAVRCVL